MTKSREILITMARSVADLQRASKLLRGDDLDAAEQAMDSAVFGLAHALELADHVSPSDRAAAEAMLRDAADYHFGRSN